MKKVRWSTIVTVGSLVLLLLAFSLTGLAQEKIKLRVTSWAGAEEAAMDQQIIAKFLETHPNVEVSYEPISDNYYQKILTDIAAGTPPDVLLLDGEMVPTFTEEKGLLLNLAPYADRMKDKPGADLSAYFPNVLQIDTVGHAVYAFPKDFTPIVIYYNKKLFDKFGVPYPPKDEWDWNQFMATVKALTRDTNGDGKTDVWGFRYVNWVGYNVPWIWAGGGAIMNPDRTKCEGYLNSPATVKTMEFLINLVKNGYSPTPETQKAFGGGAAMFYTGKVAMATSGHWWLPSIYAQIKKGADLDIGIAPIPHNPGGKNATVIYESGWAVPKSVKNRKLAVELAAWLSGPYAQKVRTANGLAISAIKSIAEEQAASSELERTFMNIVKDGRPTLGSETKFYRPLIEDTMDEAIDKVLVKGWTVQQALDWAAKTIDKTIEERL